jgi:predicted anti-sigma-YlaC factor YlaD
VPVDRRCTPVRKSLSALLDGEASEADVLTVVKHVGHCLGCRRFIADVVATSRALRAAHVIRRSSAGQRG